MREEPPYSDCKPATRKPYEAYEWAGGEIPRLALRSGGRLFCVPYYAILSFAFDFRTGDRFAFDTNDHLVTISGRNLHPIAGMMRRHACTEVNEFDPLDFDAPVPGKPLAPFVEKIDIAPRERKRQAA